MFFRFLEREEIITVNPARQLKKLRDEQRFPQPFTIDEVTHLLANCSQGFIGLRQHAMLLVLLDTGIRLGELMGLRLSDVDIATGHRPRTRNGACAGTGRIQSR